MKRFLTVLFFSLVSFTALADEDLVEYCKVDYKKDFTLYADYGKQHSDFYSQHSADISKNKWDFDEEVFFFASDKKHDSHKTIKVWSSDDDHKNALFYDDSVDDDIGATVRFDYKYRGHSKNSRKQTYVGDLTYYVYQNGQWSSGITKQITTRFTSHKAYAVFEHEDDDDELHNLRCGELDTPPENPVFKLDICPYVPNTVQTNYLLTDDKPFGALQVSASNYVHLGNYETRFFLSSSTGVRDCVLPDGTVTDCQISDQKPDIDGFPAALGSFPNTDKKPDIDCKLDNTVDCYLTPGVYKDVKVAEGATLVLQGGQYFFKELKFEATGARLEVKGPTEVNYQEILFEKSGIRINASPGSKSENLLFIGHGEDANFYLESDVSNVVVNAYVFIDKEADDKDNGFGFTGWNNTLNGGVTSHSIAISGGNNRIKATNNLNCFTPPSSDISTINIVPSNIYLQCAGSKLIYVEVFDKDGQPITDIGDSMVSLYSTTPNALTFSLVRFDADNSRFEFSIDSKAGNDYGEIEVVAHLVSNDRIKDNSHVVFAPAIFDINDGQEKVLIAGKPEQVDIKVLACSNDGNTITGNYNRTLSQEHLQANSFLPGLWSDNANKLSFDADIKQGLADATIQFDEAGQYVGRLVDTIKCEDFYQQGVEPVDCPRGESKEIIGELKFKARPWTFAVCRSDLTSLPSGDISNVSSAPFVAAGEAFDVAALPIRWQASGATTGAIATESAYCNSSLVTQNFAKGGVDSLEVKVSHNLNLPSGGEVGTLSGVVTKDSIANSTSGYYIFNDLSWDEVGQIKLIATSDKYLTMDIQPGYKNLGRFYPNHFAINKSEWLAPIDQGGVTYLSQPFDHAEVKVAAFAYGSTEPLKNYHHFSSDLQAHFNLKQDSDVSNELKLDTTTGVWRADSDSPSGFSYWELESSDAVVLRQETANTGGVITTKENGPFNTGIATTDFGLRISAIDPATFDESGLALDNQKFINQPKLRYGRMVLSSLGGTSGMNIKVPLKVEYWNGSRFIINADDDRSQFATASGYQCKQTLWSKGGASDSMLSGSNTVPWESVNTGFSDKLVASADTSDDSLREQVRFWLRLDDTSDSSHTSPQLSDADECGSNGLAQPWLQYNWRGKGDEDPSTVVTFGIYRGNDKIIFRSESGLTGQ
ncbi:MAG TPA: hypothetical protein DCS35_10665 [Vibrio sp.]|nr:hypothetical protein [Vibrio sp.]